MLKPRCPRLIVVFLTGCLMGVAVILMSPASYFQIAQTISWRLRWPAVSQEQLEQTLTGLQLRGDSMVRAGETVVFGDSHLHAIPSARLGASANYAIGGETTEHLARRIGRYQSLARAANVVLLTGRNDLAAHNAPQAIDESIARVLAQIPATAAIILVAIPAAVEPEPQVQARRETNRRFQARCEARAKCRFVRLEMLETEHGQLQPRFDAGDRVHLNSAAYELLLAAIAAEQNKK